MTFLQPLILWALPLIFLPVIIHLINRMRHRTQPWAAMRFLLSATRSSVNQAKLRQFLILLFRVLAVAALVLFLARPLAGGWLGWAFSAAPDAILVLLDRSASMESLVAGGTVSGREQAIQLLAKAAREFEETSHLVLIDSATRTPQELAGAAGLVNGPLTAGTDTGADIVEMLQSALKWLIDNGAGTAEIWIASDLQQSNWRAEDARWKSFVAQLRSLPQPVRVRVLALNTSAEANASIALRDVLRRERPGRAEVHLVADVQKNRGTGQQEVLPIEVVADGTRTQVEMPLPGQTARWRHTVGLGEKKSGGWGSVALPADSNRRDNIAYFVYGAERALQAAVVAEEAGSGRFLQLAATSYGPTAAEMAERVGVSEAARLRVDNKSLWIWQGVLPSGEVAAKVRAFAESGGVVVFFPPGVPDTTQFLGFTWGEIGMAAADRPWRAGRWDEEQGPLAKTDEGFSLPLAQAEFYRRQEMVGAKPVLAEFDDGKPLLVRETAGQGELYFCASLPALSWSTLGDGPVLVPMLQRLLQSGGKRLQQVASVACGELSEGEMARRWTVVDSTEPKVPQLNAGVYRSGDVLLAVNRPVAEDEAGVLDAEQARKLFDQVPFQFFEEEKSRFQQLQGEFWRVFLFGMLLFLLVEAALILPGRRADDSSMNSGMPVQPAAVGSK